MFGVEGRVVVVTGGLGQLGRSFTSALRQRGARVAVVDVVADEAAIEAAYGGDREGLLCLAGDVLSKPSLAAALETITRTWDTPFALINNAAIDAPPSAPPEENGPFETYPESSWDRVMAVNAKGVFLCSQTFGAAMAAAGRGSIVNISSIYGLVSPDQRLYD